MKNGAWQAAVQRILMSHRIPFHTRQRKNQFEITVNSHKSVKRLIQVVKPYLVVKKQLVEELASFPVAPARNRFSQIDRLYLDAVCEKIDFVRRFNKGKNRRYKWDSKTIRSFYN